ncbi:MAG: D-alanyl-D-alanine carboxypeptidase [Alphaproteobacteria bacterium]|nr:D-alanyl-D-alanine carboxypeptidase [Alphaproteobacteria bacterium]
MFKKLLLSLLISCLFGVSSQAAKPKKQPPVVAAHQKQVVPEATKPELPASAIPVDIEVTAKQAILADYQTGAVLLQKNADESMHPSSMTKIMTAYLVMDKIKSGIVKPDTVLTVGKNGWKVEGSSMMLNINDQVKIDELLKGLIISSGNDAAVVLAEGLSGTENTFAAEMTRKAQEMGANQTRFLNASGLPHSDHLTTARDLLTISMRVVDDFPEFYHLYSEKEYTYGGIKQGNRNPLLYKNIGCDGIKTGHSNAGGYGMVASCIQDGQRLILIINGLPSMQARADEAMKLVTWGRRTFANYTLFKAQQLIEQIPVWYGRENFLPVTVEKDAVIALARVGRKDMVVKLKYESPIAAPIQKGTVVGHIIVTSPALPKPIEIPLVAAITIEKAGFFKRMKDSVCYLIWGNPRI